MKHIAALVIGLSACTGSVQALRFRTGSPDTALVRLVQAVGQHCQGVEAVDQAGGFVMSTWREWPLEEGVIRSRCVATLVTEKGEAFTDVLVTFVLKYCAAPGSFEIDDDAPDGCRVVSEAPEAVAAALTAAATQLELDVQR